MTAAADVTVVMPALNRAHLIERSLASIAGQRERPAEVIVIDDGSTDDTAAVAKRAGATVIQLPESGGSGPARNRGIEAASTEWVAFLDSDDEWEPDHLARLMARARGQVLVTAPGRSDSGRIMGNPWRHELTLDPLTLLTPGDVVCTSGTAVRRQTLLDAGLFRPLRRAQDLDLWLRVLEHGPGLALTTPTVLYHEHGGQASRDRELMRQCFDWIVDDCSSRGLLTIKHRDQAYSRVHWDDLRTAQRAGDVREVTRFVQWFARRPHALPPLVRLLRQRRLSRTG
ncbi:glycosyltransferase family 2 protein [Kineococcus auxinigenes]|uniref:glycosyltransferase family 2 protein n=1 Tax=unclassified Kineococcus TaxID=2621656 RepID=UPI003D7EC197